MAQRDDDQREHESGDPIDDERGRGVPLGHPGRLHESSAQAEIAEQSGKPSERPGDRHKPIGAGEQQPREDDRGHELCGLADQPATDNPREPFAA